MQDDRSSAPGKEYTFTADGFVVTTDGSLSLFDEATGELYHNRAGAYSEALITYVQPADAVATLRQNGSLRVLDACFGMGYNSFVLIQQLAEAGVPGEVVIEAVENDPKVLEAAWSRAIKDERLSLAHSLLLGQRSGLNMVLNVVQDDLRQVVPRLACDLDVVFHDPFSPRKVPELWTVDIFRKYFHLLSARRGRVLTYSIAGAVRGGLIEAGFEVWRTTAIGGKYGGTLALFPGTPPPPDCQPGAAGYGDRRGGRRSLVPFRDPTFSLTKDELLLRRSYDQGEIES